MYSDSEIKEALATNNKEVLEKLAVYILLESQKIKFNPADIISVSQDDPRRLDVVYLDCNFQIKEIMNLQQDCLLEDHNGDRDKWSQLNIGIDKRGDVYKRIIQGERPVGKIHNVAWFDLGLAIKKEVNKAVNLYSDIDVRRKMDLFLFVTQPRICLGTLEQIRNELQGTGFRSIFALIYDKKFINIAQSDTTPDTLKKLKE